MHKLMLCCAAAVVLSPCSVAQDAREVLSKAREAVGSLGSYDIEVTRTYDSGAQPGGNRSSSRERLAVSGTKSRREEQSGRVSIGDGEFLWTYIPGRGEYTKQPAKNATGTDLWAPYSPSGAKVIREESVPIGGRLVLCWVIDLPAQSVRLPHESQGPATLWIDEATYLPVKRTSSQTIDIPGQGSRETTTTLAITKAVYRQPLPDSLFKPDLADTAAEVQQLGFGTRSPLMGKSLPLIEGVDLQGNPIMPAMWKDKWLVLRLGDISSTEEMWFFELLYRAFKDRRVTVLNIVVTPRPADARSQLAHYGYTLPSMLAPDGMTPASMGFTSQALHGAILADPAGKVVYHTNDVMSSRMPDDIVKALMAAGQW